MAVVGRFIRTPAGPSVNVSAGMPRRGTPGTNPTPMMRLVTGGADTPSGQPLTMPSFSSSVIAATSASTRECAATTVAGDPPVFAMSAGTTARHAAAASPLLSLALDRRPAEDCIEGSPRPTRRLRVVADPKHTACDGVVISREVSLLHKSPPDKRIRAECGDGAPPAGDGGPRPAAGFQVAAEALDVSPPGANRRS